MNKQLFTYLFFFFVSMNMSSQSRQVYTINENWKFHKGGLAFAQRATIKNYPLHIDDTWETVSIPHTWNSNDPFDDKESYSRGIGWYRKNLTFSDSLKNKNIYLHFEGANQVADVYVNGAFVGSHKGGYTAFTLDITKHVNFENSNLIAVKVDNSHSNVIPPLSVGYGLYGGIYRDVWIKTTEKVHFNMLNHGSSGVFVSTPNVSKNNASVVIKGSIVNEDLNAVNLNIKHIILDDKGQKITHNSQEKEIESKNSETFNSDPIIIDNPKLWSPEKPTLYKIKTQIFLDKKLVDEVVNPLGFRWFSFDSEKGFVLNGKKYLLKGTNRHQDKEGLGSALPNSMHVEDLKLIKEMGANFLRLAHYPQDPAVLKAADEIGLLLWEEIPVVNYVNRSKEFSENAQYMLREMIRQHYNHPSIILWGSCNEIFLWDELGKRSSTIEDVEYMEWTRNFVKNLNDIIHEEDSGRKSTLAMHGSSDYDSAGISSIPDVTSINLYSGWYGGEFKGFGETLDKRHKKYPNQALFVSEYGAGSDSRINGVAAKRFDFSGNYQRTFHESYWQQIRERPWLSGSALWNQFDFSQPHTGGSIQHINQKGVQTWNREKKDSYYFYQSNWLNNPVLYIASREWKQRNGFRLKNGTYLASLPKTQEIEIYTNLKKVELFQNGKSLGKKTPNSLKKIVWNVVFKEGENTFLAKGKAKSTWLQDTVQVNFKAHTTNLNVGEELFINAGFNGEFVDEDKNIWLPDQAYVAGGYGALNGEYVMANKDLIVINANNKSVLYNYSLEDVKEYKIDVPDGIYEVELFFAETKYYKNGDRIFNVNLNDEPVLENFDIYKEKGFLKAFSVEVEAKALDSKGFIIDMNATEGETLISALRIKRKQ